MGSAPVSFLEYLSVRYPPTLSVEQVGEITSEHPQTIRNMVSKGTYRIPSFKIGRKRAFRLIDVAAYVDDQFSASVKGPKLRRGRPTKVEQLLKRRSALLVSHQGTRA